MITKIIAKAREILNTVEVNKETYVEIAKKELDKASEEIGEGLLEGLDKFNDILKEAAKKKEE